MDILSLISYFFYDLFRPLFMPITYISFSLFIILAGILKKNKIIFYKSIPYTITLFFTLSFFEVNNHVLSKSILMILNGNFALILPITLLILLCFFSPLYSYKDDLKNAEENS